MQLKTRTPRDFINALLSKKSIHPAPFAAFKQAVQDFVQAAKNQHASGQTEPNMVTNALKPFIDSLGYNSSPYSQKGQIGIDLVIQQNGKPAVIIEAKRPSSREMMTEQDVNKKAFHEAVYYFMRERDAGNDGLTSVVVTDFDNWFVFDAKDFERLFWDNTAIQKIYQTHKNPNLLSTTTADFYHALELALPKQHADLVSHEVIDCAHFNLLLAYNDTELAAIYKLLSADCLLKVFNPNDANSLNREFYNELLYILGLEETKQGGKKLINQALTPQTGSLYENTSDKLAQYYKTNDFEAVIKLMIIWINRILFLKLLESQIVTWTDQKNHKFLLSSKIADYVSLENLFFNILAKKIQDRGSNQFDYIPYLNSSLFEVHADELKGITIATLAGDAQMDYYNKTVVKDNLSHKKTGKVNTLAYLFEFLDAYDFANDSKDEITTDNKSLISASVLGLIFEKINGYKDGSFYTPSFVTMYMAKETIEKTVLQKFNLAKDWECKTLVELDNKLNIADIAESNAIINDIKICDPAVGSGHFLVSALNEILRIKSHLGILMDESGKRIKDYAVTIENDELILKDFEDGTFFEYKKGHFEKTRIQKTLFKEKQKIIESCLFGVDINPNSVNICRLRLWVELLKNAYYKPDGTLDTLPNIDINIKCGNSLISRFDIKDDLKSRSIQAEIKDYKDCSAKSKI
jgi:adenine-specific DNA-methyltransferase